MSLPDRTVDTEMDWYAVKLKARQNGGRRETLLGVEYETYKAGNGRMVRRKVKGSGQRVFVPELVLQKAGFEVFLPVKREWQRISRFRPEKELRSRPAMEGWLFVGWPAGQARFHELLALDVVAGVMGAGGQPVRISDAKVRFLMRKFGGGRKRRRSSDVDQPRFAAGDLVRVEAGPLEGQKFALLDVTGGSARAVMTLLGKDVEVELEQEFLAAAQ
ncbi:transcription termination/antitermination protein NusG [Phaeobacter italicus]|uniref:transcription termination/antitermination protein NusG n=3 Tax=Phaeobacter italicus TaxID=481446 RepID=UPI00232B3262|nr:transcription termination/antitermination NusG family protein [Phaeobacter italicus]